MALKEVDYTHNLAATLATMGKHGLLLTSADAAGKPNVMTIGWGTPGIIWGRHIFVVLVRPSRYTWGNIEATGEFVVSVPTDDMHDVCMHCGTASGRDGDKFQDCGLTLLDAQTVKVPLIQQCCMHYECRVVLRNDVAPSQLDEEICAGSYGSGDFHRIYYGDILRVTAKE